MAKEIYERSENYRYEFLKKKHGIKLLGEQWFLCAYCGKPIRREDMQVDHVVSVDLAKKNRFYRFFVPKEGINSIHNLTASCSKCNQRKSNRGGVWILKGKIGWQGRLVCQILLVCFYVAEFLIFSGFVSEVRSIAALF